MLYKAICLLALLGGAFAKVRAAPVTAERARPPHLLSPPEFTPCTPPFPLVLHSSRDLTRGGSQDEAEEKQVDIVIGIDLGTTCGLEAGNWRVFPIENRGFCCLPGFVVLFMLRVLFYMKILGV